MTCSAFLGCAAAAYGRSSIFFFAPFFDKTHRAPLLQCTSGGAETAAARNHSMASIPPREDYLICAFMLSNISTGIMFFIGALIVGYGGVAFSSARNNNDQANQQNAGGNNANSAGTSASSMSSAGAGVADGAESDDGSAASVPILASNAGSRPTTVDDLPGQSYFTIFLVATMASFLLSGVSGLLSLPAVSGTSEATAKAAIGVFMAGAVSCGTAVLSLMAGISVRWPNLYDVLFFDEPRGVHGIKPRRVDRSSNGGSGHGGGGGGGGGAYTARSSSHRSNLESDDRDTLDYLHLALVTPPALVLIAMVIGWCVASFFADVFLQNIAADLRSPVFSFALCSSTSLIATLFARAADCFSVDSTDEFDDSASILTSARAAAGASGGRPPLAPPSVRSVATSVHSSHQDGVGWSTADFEPEFFRSSLRLLGVAMAEVCITPKERDEEQINIEDPDAMNNNHDHHHHHQQQHNHDTSSNRSNRSDADNKSGCCCCRHRSTWRFDPEDMPRRLASRITRSLRLLGTYLLFIMWPYCLTSMMNAQVRVSSFFLTLEPSVRDRIYNKNGSLNVQPPLSLIFWLFLYILTLAVFARSGFIRYLLYGFILQILAAASVFFLQAASQEEFTPSRVNANAFHVEVAVFLPPALLAASQMQLLLFSLSLGFCVLPRPMFPLAMCTLFFSWSLGDFSAIRAADASATATTSTMFLTAAINCSILTLLKFLLVLKLKSAFEHPKTLFAKIREESSAEAQGSGQQDALARDRDGSTLSTRAADFLHVLPPHRLLHWSPAAIDSAFAIMESTESMYHPSYPAAPGAAAAVSGGGGGGRNSPMMAAGSGGRVSPGSGMHGATVTGGGGSGGGSGLDDNMDNGPRRVPSVPSPQAPPLGGATPRRPKKGSDLKQYYAVRR